MPNLDLIELSHCDTAADMKSTMCIVCDSTMTRFDWAVEDVVR
jgi:hypothetical protein